MFTTLACALEPPIMYSSLNIIRFFIELSILILIFISIVKIIWNGIHHQKILNPTTNFFLITITVFLVGTFFQSFIRYFLKINNLFGDYWENYWILYLYWGIVFAILWWTLRKIASNKCLIFFKIITITLFVLSLIIIIAKNPFFERKNIINNSTTNTKENTSAIPESKTKNIEYNPNLIPFKNTYPLGCSGNPSLF